MKCEGRRNLPDGALGPLRAACLEHGIISLLLELRGARTAVTDAGSSTVR